MMSYKTSIKMQLFEEVQHIRIKYQNLSKFLETVDSRKLSQRQIDLCLDQMDLLQRYHLTLQLRLEDLKEEGV
jgi:hypothetical protein